MFSKRILMVFISILYLMISAGYADNIDQLLQNSEDLMAQQKYTEAKALLVQALVDNSEHPGIYYNLGMVSRLMGQYDLSAVHYGDALKYDSQNPMIYLALAQSYKEAKRYKQAIDALEKALVLDMTNSSPYFNMGNIYVLMEDYPKAYVYFQMAVFLESEHIAAKYNLANVCFKLRKMLLAIAHYEDVIAAQPEHTMAYFQLGRTYSFIGDVENAIMYLQKAKDIFQSGDNDEVVTELNSLLEELRKKL